MSGWRQIIKEHFPALAAVGRRVRAASRAARSPGRIFTDIYRSGAWSDGETRSGPGSSLARTSAVREALPGIIGELGCRSLLDIPCGDFFWMKSLELDVDYIGADIVPDIAEINQRRFGSERRRFMCLDIARDELPAADLVFCRDCLVHLPHAEVLRALGNIRRSGSRYLLTTTFSQRESNDDIPMGEWRPLNLQRPPFNLPPPIRLIDEQCPEPGFADKHLGLWAIEQIPSL